MKKSSLFLAMLTILSFNGLLFGAHPQQKYQFYIYKNSISNLVEYDTWDAENVGNGAWNPLKHLGQQVFDATFRIDPNDHVFCPGDEIIIKSFARRNNNAVDYGDWTIAIGNTPPNSQNGGIPFYNHNGSPLMVIDDVYAANAWESAYNHNPNNGAEHYKSITIPTDLPAGEYFLIIDDVPWHLGGIAGGSSNCQADDKYMLYKFTVVDNPEPLQDLFYCASDEIPGNINVPDNNVTWSNLNPNDLTIAEAVEAGGEFPYEKTNGSCSIFDVLYVELMDWSSYDPGFNDGDVVEICNLGSHQFVANSLNGFSAKWYKPVMPSPQHPDGKQLMSNSFAFIPNLPGPYFLIVTSDNTPKACSRRYDITVTDPCDCSYTHNIGPNNFANFQTTYSSGKCLNDAVSFDNAGYTIYHSEWTVRQSGFSIPTQPIPGENENHMQFTYLPGTTYEITFAFIYNNNGTCYRRYYTKNWTAPGGIIITPWGKKSMEEGKGVEIKAYPNPSKGEFNLTLPAVENTIQVFDMTGALVHEEKMNGNSKLYLNDKESGVYIMKVSNENGVETIRLNINN